MFDPTGRFSGRVENYVRYRPGYPTEVLVLLQEECGMVEDSIVADIGSGTGFLSRLFLENGNRVFGVEPNEEMRLAGERLLAGYERFTSVTATAEATTLPESRVDFVTAGQAFHWFDPIPTRAEFERVLKPGGWVVLMWNARKKTMTPFLEDYERMLESYGTDYTEVDHGRRGSYEEVRKFFVPEKFEMATFENQQIFDFDGLKGRLLSSSYVPNEGDEGCTEILRELERIFHVHERGGRVSFDYDTKVYYGRLLGAGPSAL